MSLAINATWTMQRSLSCQVDKDQEAPKGLKAKGKHRNAPSKSNAPSAPGMHILQEIRPHPQVAGSGRHLGPKSPKNPTFKHAHQVCPNSPDAVGAKPPILTMHTRSSKRQPGSPKRVAVCPDRTTAVGRFGKRQSPKTAERAGNLRGMLLLW